MSVPAVPTINIAVNASGAVPTPIATIWANYIQLVAEVNPGYTVLPAGLIEDLASTGTYAIALLESAAIELINSVSPFGANSYLLVELGNVYGVPQGQETNTSVYVVFTSNTDGLQIPIGYIVSDGAHQYQVQNGGVIETGGVSQPLFCVATQSGSWAVPANTVQTIVSSIPNTPTVTLTCTNPNTGTPAVAAQSEAQYAALVLQAGLVTGQGNASMCKTLMADVPGVQPRLISVRQGSVSGWEVICGGGDPYAVAAAIYNSGLDISTLVGSTINITGITNANPGVVTTDLNHGLVTGQSDVHIAGVTGMTGVNGGPYTVTVISPDTFSFGVDTTASGSYASGGVVTPNARNVSVSLNDYPDVYTVIFTNPPQQTTALQLGWNTTSANFVSNAAIEQLATTPLVNYINSIPVGAAINLIALNNVFVNAVLPLFNNNPELISTLNWTVTINGTEVAPTSGTSLVEGDPSSFFFIASSSITIAQV